ncbi:hypothetical protein [Micromonospora sp. WMMD1082]|uniref:hypothetical protein n=1 Tax=Micromonospora sp. WMMD1082 TaxID=3016104 RepID=UPI0024173A4C|nr:hypothetical protein [Micromonospora sp. WMMD1082]MDG4796229.1 hypothetical protein [Micromonospora sp. WMMD1082]
MITIERMMKEAEQLTEGEKCPWCNSTRTRTEITCPAHLTDGEYEIDPATGLAWCFNCDTAEITAPKIICPCQG